MDFANLRVYCPCGNRCKGNRNGSPRRCNYEGHTDDLFTGNDHRYECPACHCVWIYKQNSIQIGEDRIAKKTPYSRCR